MAKAANKTIHVDILGTELDVGNYVAVAHHNNLYVCVIVTLHPKQIRVKKISKTASTGEILIYSSDVVKIAGVDAMAFVLKNT